MKHNYFVRRASAAQLNTSDARLDAQVKIELGRLFRLAAEDGWDLRSWPMWFGIFQSLNKWEYRFLLTSVPPHHPTMREYLKDESGNWIINRVDDRVRSSILRVLE